MKLLHSFLFVSFIIPLFWCCTKTDTTSSQTATQAMFWVDSDLGCGSITVTLNGVSKNITGYYTSTPTCGSSYAATFDLPSGTYSFTARCSTKTWSGNIIIQDGQCNVFKLNSGGGSASGGGVTTAPTVTTPNTLFIASQDYTVSAFGGNWTQQFTLSKTTSFVFRFASQYQAQAAIFTTDQLSNFQTNKSFSGFGLFNNQIGTNYVTLNAGTYYIGIRNTTNGANKWSTELDYTTTLPTSDRATFVDNYITGARSLTTGNRFSQAFTVQSGYRYFLDGCNVNCDVRIIDASQLNAFQAGQSYQYYTSYYNADGGSPGFYELLLPAGTYYLVSYNATSGALSFVLERWKVN